MIERLNKIRQSSFVRNVAIVATGTAGAQAISMVFMPFVTRLYGPEAFGLLGLFTAILAVLTPIAALSYPIAIVLPKSDSEALNIAKLSAMLAVSISSVLLLLLLIFSDSLAALLNAESIEQYFWLLPIAMLLAAFKQIMTQWIIRLKKFKLAAKVAVIQSLIIGSAKVGVGIWHPLAGVLIILQSIAGGLYALHMWFAVNLNDSCKTLAPKQKLMKGIACKYFDFPLYRAPQQFINALSQGLPVIMLAGFFGPAAAGFYALTKTAMGLPSGLIGKAVGDVFYPRISEAANNKENLFDLILKATLALIAAGFFPFGFVVVFGPWLFVFVFGAEWLMAGEYARWLAIWLFFGLINKPSVTAIATIRLQGFFLAYEAVSVLIRIGSLYLGFAIYSSDKIAVALFCSVSVLLNAFLIVTTLVKSKAFKYE